MEEHKDPTTDKVRKSGETWMISGPTHFIQGIEVRIKQNFKAQPLAEREGIYVRDLKTGQVKLVTGPQTYKLGENEVLWKKELNSEVEALLGFMQQGRGFAPAKLDDKGNYVYDYGQKSAAARDKSKAVTVKAPHNSAAQIFNYMNKEARIMFGPELLMLQPYEDITLIKLSGGMPKVEDAIKNLSLLMGPDFMTDRIQVETCDHARLYLKLAYRWVFKIDKKDEKQCHSLFSVRDFVGDACKTMSSRIRGAVSSATFDYFHKNSSELIRNAIFKKSEDGDYIPFLMKANNLTITQVDIQSIDPVDEETRLSLQKSINLAFDIQTQSQQAAAKH
jgi:major vault protein